jgi:hypothetical protein
MLSSIYNDVYHLKVDKSELKELNNRRGIQLGQNKNEAYS